MISSTTPRPVKLEKILLKEAERDGQFYFHFPNDKTLTASEENLR